MKRLVNWSGLLLILSSFSIGFGQSPPTSAKSLIGLWGTEQVLGPRVRGELILDGRREGWRARIAGFDVAVERKGKEIRFALPEGQGDFRGQLSEDSKTLTGHWIQPQSNIFPRRYATPVEFRSALPAVWTGEVHPLPEQLSFYIWIQPLVDGTLVAKIRNIEFGWFSRATFPVQKKGAEISFGSGQNLTIGTYDSSADHFTLGLLNPPAAPLVFTRRTDQNAIGFYPRSPPAQTPSYTYRQPIPKSDGWTTASIEKVGLTPKPISDLMLSILSADPNDKDFIPIHSVLIAKHGKLAVEEYFYGFERDRPHDMRSAGKTLAPILVGLARDQGARVQPSTSVFSMFPEYKPFDNWDERKNQLTIRDLMTMTSGLDCEDNDGSSPGGENQMQSQTQQNDWYKYTLDLPMKNKPGGTAAIYCSASLNLAGGVAERASGMWNADLFHRYLAQPLQFGTYHLNLMPTGDVYTGGGAYLRPRDELKLGQVYLASGVWNGRRIISKSWVEQSTTPHATFVKPVIAEDVNHQYGFGWHIYHYTVDGHRYRVYEAGGNGGQFVIVIPDLDMVVAINAGGYGNIGWYRWGLAVIPRYLIPAGKNSGTETKKKRDEI